MKKIVVLALAGCLTLSSCAAASQATDASELQTKTASHSVTDTVKTLTSASVNEAMVDVDCEEMVRELRSDPFAGSKSAGRRCFAVTAETPHQAVGIASNWAQKLDAGFRVNPARPTPPTPRDVAVQILDAPSTVASIHSVPPILRRNPAPRKTVLVIIEVSTSA